VSFLLYEFIKPEYYYVREVNPLDEGEFLHLESNKLIFHEYEKIYLNTKDAEIIDTEGNNINKHEFKETQKLKVNFKPPVGFSKPPISGAFKITIIEK
jgi:hypothetical protein